MKKRRVRRVFRDKGCVTEATQGEMAMDELNKTIHAGLLDRGKDNDRYDALVKAADVVEDELTRVLKDVYPGSGKPSLNIQPISYRILQFDVFTPDHVEFNIEAIPSRGGDATIYNLKVEFPFGDDQLEDEKYDAIKKLRGGHGNIKSIKGVLNLIKQGGSLYKSQTGPLAAEPEAQAQLPFGESKMKKITKSKLNAIIKEEIENVIGSLQEAEGLTEVGEGERIRQQNFGYVRAVVNILNAVLKGHVSEDGQPPDNPTRLKKIQKTFQELRDTGKSLNFRGSGEKSGITVHAEKIFLPALQNADPEVMKKLGLRAGGANSGASVSLFDPLHGNSDALARLKPKKAEPEAKPGLLKRGLKAIGLGNRPEDY
jgi:hypothetical protein